MRKEGLNPNQFYTISGLGNGYLNNVGESFENLQLKKIKKEFSSLEHRLDLEEKGEPFSEVPLEKVEVLEASTT